MVSGRFLFFATLLTLVIAEHRHVRQADSGAGPSVVWMGDSIFEQLASSTVWREWFAPLNSLNLAVGGHRTEDLKKLIDGGALDSVKPKVAVILIGTNNGRDEPETISDKIVEIVELVQRKLTNATVLVVELLPRSQRPDAIRERNASTNRFLREALKDRAGVRLVGYGEDLVDDNQEISRQDMPDFLHLSVSGYRKAFNPLYKVLRELLPNKKTQCMFKGRKTNK